MSNDLPALQAIASRTAEVSDEKKPEDVTVSTLGLTHDRLEAARQDALRQAGMSVREAIGKYRYAALWAGLMTLTVVMEAYDYGASLKPSALTLQA